MFCCALLDSGSMFTFINITTTSNCEFNRIFITFYNEPVGISFRYRYYVIKTGSLHQFNSRNNFFSYCLPMTFFVFVILAEYLESWSFGTNLLLGFLMFLLLFLLCHTVNHTNTMPESIKAIVEPTNKKYIFLEPEIQNIKSRTYVLYLYFFGFVT